MRWKWIWWGTAAIVWLATFFGVISLPKDWESTLSWLTPIEQWWASHAAHPTLAAFITGLAIATVLLPELWSQIRPHLFPMEYEADISVIDAFNFILRRSKWAKREEKRQFEKASAKADKTDAKIFADTMVRVNLAQEFHNRLKKGKLKSWGRTFPDRPEDCIDRNEWENIWLDFSDAALRGDPNNSCAWLRNGQTGQRIKFILIRVSKKQLLREFPSALTSRKVTSDAEEKTIAV